MCRITNQDAALSGGEEAEENAAINAEMSLVMTRYMPLKAPERLLDQMNKA